LNIFDERGDDVDQPINTNKDPLHVLNGPMTWSKTKALKKDIECIGFEGFDRVRFKGSIRTSRGGLHIFYPCAKGSNSTLFGP